MDSHGVSAGTASKKTVTIAGIEFENNFYERDADVLYLHVGDPATAVDFGATPEGHHTRYGPDGSLVGLTIVNARWLLEEEGEIVLTLPEQRVRATEFGAVLTDAVENLGIAALAANRSAKRGEKSVELDEAMEMLGFDPNEHSLG